MLTHKGNDPPPLRASIAESRNELEVVREQVDRILSSDTLRASEVLRRLLRFLADKAFAGEADHLKEYSIGLDALGKPPTYDPRQDAAVRLQASRLRQKLDEYYRSEGKNDPVIVELPKGSFKIVWRPKSDDNILAGGVPSQTTAQLPGQSTPVVEARRLQRWRSLAISMAAVSLLLVLVTIWSLSRASRTLIVNPAIAGMTPELDALWSPFRSSSHHLIIAFINPLFVRLQRNGSPDIIYRTRGNNSWEAAVRSPEFSIMVRSLGNPSAKPTFNMVERSSLVSTFVLSQFLARHRGDISLARSDELSWQDFAENDVIQFAPFTIDKGDSALPVRPALIVDNTGVRNLKPSGQEPAVYPDPPDHQESDGEGLELVSVLPGPLGRTTVMTFSSNHAWGVIGGVQSLTDPAFASVLVKKLKEPSGSIPSYYQILFRISYRDGTPTNASYVTHKVLNLTQNSPEARTAN